MAVPVSARGEPCDSLALALLIAFAALPASLRAADGAYPAAVTEQNLLASERYWPYHVALTKPFQALRPGTTGVLIRVESSSVARIDFGRDGLFEVPVAATDLVARANRVQRGELAKRAPNFVFALGPRLRGHGRRRRRGSTASSGPASSAAS